MTVELEAATTPVIQLFRLDLLRILDIHVARHAHVASMRHRARGSIGIEAIDVLPSTAKKSIDFYNIIDNELKNTFVKLFSLYMHRYIRH